MSEAFTDVGLPAGFAGRVRLFPLPNLVLFPHAVQPLHIFEPRYRALLEDALRDDGLITLTLLQPGWQADYDGRPPIFPVGCVGRVVSHTRLEDGLYNLLVLGLRRVSILRELPPSREFRVADVAVLEDLYPAQTAGRRLKMRVELLSRFRRLLPQSPAAKEQFEQLASRDLPLGVLTDLLAFMLELELNCKQALLSQWNVDLRAAALLEQLHRSPDESQRPAFPPPFSGN